VTGEQAAVNSECRYQENYYRCVNAGERQHRPCLADAYNRRFMGWLAVLVAYGVLWRYLHSGFGVCRITSVSSDGLTATADVVARQDGEIELPAQVVG
jgi:hypothetical protein